MRRTEKEQQEERRLAYELSRTSTLRDAADILSAELGRKVSYSSVRRWAEQHEREFVTNETPVVTGGDPVAALRQIVHMTETYELTGSELAEVYSLAVKVIGFVDENGYGETGICDGCNELVWEDGDWIHLVCEAGESACGELLFHTGCESKDERYDAWTTEITGESEFGYEIHYCPAHAPN